MATLELQISCSSICETYVEVFARWLSCNGEVWGIGPTAVFAAAAVLFLYNELESTFLGPGDRPRAFALEKVFISTMLAGMLALMTHLWVCSTRLFQYYLDTIITDSPNALLEMTTAGLLQGKLDKVPLGPLTKFLRQQQPQIHITMCWFVSLCYADYVRKNYCSSFNFPYLEEWQAELHERAARSVHRAVTAVNSFIGSVHARLRACAQSGDPAPPNDNYTMKERGYRGRRLPALVLALRKCVTAPTHAPALRLLPSSVCVPSAIRVAPPRMQCETLQLTLRKLIRDTHRLYTSLGLLGTRQSIENLQCPETPCLHD